MIRRLLRRGWLGSVAAVATLFGRKKGALAAYQRLIDAEPNNERALAIAGNLFAEQGDVPQAMATLQRVLDINPHNAESWFNLGYLHEQREELVEAERCFRRAVEIRPSIDRAWYGLGLVLIRQLRLGEAVTALKKNTELQPFSPFGWYQLGMTYHHLGDKKEAQRVYEQLRHFEPRYAATLKRDIEATRSIASERAARTGKPSQEDSA